MPQDNLYNLLLLAHLITAVVGFGSAITWSFLGARARGASAPVAAGLGAIVAKGSSVLTAPFIWASGLFGILLVVAGDLWEFSQTWISIAFLLYFAAAGVAQFLLVPQQRKLVALLDELAAMPDGSERPQAQLAALDDRQKQVAIYTGIVHLSFLLLMLDMIFKPGWP